MAVYWLTFRLKDDRDYARRYDELTEGVRRISSRWWPEATSFLLFDSDQTIDDVADHVRDLIDERGDLVLIGMSEFKSARVLGPVRDADLFALMPFTKKA